MSLMDAIAAVPRPAPSGPSGEFWNKEDPVLVGEGENRQVVKGGLWPHQREWWESKAFYKVLVGGYASGKTLLLCKRAIASALQNAPCLVTVVSPTYPVARNTTISTINELLTGKRRLYGRAFWWRLNKTANLWEIKFHGRRAYIQQASGDNPNSLKGPNLAGAYIDEPFVQDRAVFEQMIARVRHPEARYLELGFGGTPEELNWGYDLCVGELREEIEKGGDEVHVTTASTRLNRAIRPSFANRLAAAYTERAAQAYLEGKFVSLAEGTVYYGFDPMENVVELKMPKGAEIIAGMDFNVNPMACAVMWRKGDHIHIFDEIELPNADTEFMCSTLREKYWDDGLRTIYPDPTGRARHTNAPGGRTDYTYIRRAGFDIQARPPGQPLRKDRYNAVNGKFKPREGRLTLTVSPSCKRLRKYLTTYTHENMNKKDHKDMSHLLDAFSYPVEYLFPVDYNTMRAERLQGI